MKPCQFEARECSSQPTSVLTLVSLKPATSHTRAKNYTIAPLLLDSSEYQIDKLQHIQNMACRVIFQLRKHDHIMHHLKLLHWLKIRQRIAYKIAFLIHRCKNNPAPVYLQELLPSKQHGKPLRSSTTEYLNSDFCKNTHTLRSSFSAAGPRI